MIKTQLAEQSRAEQSRAEQEACYLGNLYGDRIGTGMAGNVWNKDGLCQALMTMQCGGRQPHVIETEKIICRMQGRNPDNPSDRRKGIDLEQRLEPNEQGICNTLTSVQKDNLVLEKHYIAYDEQNRCTRDETFGTLTTDGSSPKHNNRVIEAELISYDDYNSKVCEDQDVIPTLTTNCGASALRNGVKMIKVRQATKDGFALCELGGGCGFGLSIIGNSQRQGDRERTDKPDTDNGEYP